MKTTNQQTFFAILLANTGCIIEWFEFSIFAFLAPTLSQLFFHNLNQSIGLILTFSLFALAYLCRPLGGLLFGYIGDRYGRVRSLTWSSLLMAVSTALIGCIPSSQTFGMISPLLLLLCRLVQGLSLGGENSGAMIYGGESRWKKHETLLSALPNTAGNIGILLCTLSITLLSHTLSSSNLLAWGWRIPFIAIGCIGILLFLLRLRMHETDHYKKLIHIESHPIRKVFKQHRLTFVTMFLLIWAGGVTFYTVGIYMPTFLSTNHILSLTEATSLNTVAMLLMLILVPSVSVLADKCSRKTIMLIFTISILLCAIFCFSLIVSRHVPYIITGILILTIISSLSQGTVPIMCVSLFPTSLRFTGVSFGYNLSYGIIGGTMPLIATILLQQTHHWLALPLYMMFSAVMTLISLMLLVPKTHYS